MSRRWQSSWRAAARITSPARSSPWMAVTPPRRSGRSSRKANRAPPALLLVRSGTALRAAGHRVHLSHGSRRALQDARQMPALRHDAGGQSARAGRVSGRAARRSAADSQRASHRAGISHRRSRNRRAGETLRNRTREVVSSVHRQPGSAVFRARASGVRWRGFPLEYGAAQAWHLPPARGVRSVHEKLFHLFIVSQDLQYFAHVHPEFDGAAFRLNTVLPKPGTYRLLADFYPTGGTPQLAPKNITTAGYTTPLEAAIPQLAPDLSPKRGENLEVELKLDPPQPIAGKKTMLFVHLTPAEGLEPYIGAWAHLLAVSNDLVDTIHDHPFIAGGGPDMQFNIFFPREAAYRVWIQFQRKGVVNTVAFTIPVTRSEEHTSELQSLRHLVCRLLLEKKRT